MMNQGIQAFCDSGIHNINRMVYFTLCSAQVLHFSYKYEDSQAKRYFSFS